MRKPYLSVGRLERKLWNDHSEAITFKSGVNLLIGPPNTGKTKWLKTLDYLLGDPGGIESVYEDHMLEKYVSASAEFLIGDERLHVERRWTEAGARTKVFVNGLELSARDFQHFLMERLGIPLLHFPRGNPMSGQTWPELSFRTLLRHIYRQQLMWGDLADKQPEGEQHACLLQFMGIAEHIFTEEYGQLVKYKMELERLKVRREQYGLTLNQLGREMLSDTDLQVSVTTATVRDAEERLSKDMALLRMRRSAILSNASAQAVPQHFQNRARILGEKRVTLLSEIEAANAKSKELLDRQSELSRFKSDLSDELGRLERTQDAGAALADLKITHCPACDQTVSAAPAHSLSCHLCHQTLPDGPLIEELGAMRLRFEKDRLGGELKEADQLIGLLERERAKLNDQLKADKEDLRMVENELAPTRTAVSGFAQEAISAIDMSLGELNEKQRQIARLWAALEIGKQLDERVHELQRLILPLQGKVDDAASLTDFDRAEELLAAGMNEYLSKINDIRPRTWRHSEVRVHLSRNSFSIKVGSRKWSAALGGTDTLYFLMAYHYGLLAMSPDIRSHYPGLSVIDLPGDFLGESVEDKENFIVQPFIDLLTGDKYQGAQVIITGASFAGLEGAHRETLRHIHVG